MPWRIAVLTTILPCMLSNGPQSFQANRRICLHEAFNPSIGELTLRAPMTPDVTV